MRSFRIATRWLAIAMTISWIAPLGAVADKEDKQELSPLERLNASREERQAARKGSEERAANREKKRLEREARADAVSRPQRDTGDRLLWWNDAGIAEELGLSAALRKEFDAALEKSKKGGGDVGRTATREAKNGYHNALKSGDFKLAKQQLAAWLEQSALPIRSTGELKVEVLGKLSSAQLATLKANYSSIFVTRWVPRTRWAAPKTPPASQ